MMLNLFWRRVIAIAFTVAMILIVCHMYVLPSMLAPGDTEVLQLQPESPLAIEVSSSSSSSLSLTSSSTPQKHDQPTQHTQLLSTMRTEGSKSSSVIASTGATTSKSTVKYIDSSKDPFLVTFKSECEKTKIENDLLAKDGQQQCPCIPKDLVGRRFPDLNVPSWEELEAAHPDVEDGGHWKPSSCIARQRACLIVPYRDREVHLRIWLKTMLPFMKKQNTDFRILIAEQNNGSRFNRGMLMNAAVAQAQKEGLHCDCIIIHDVDHVPEDDRNMYFCQNKPIHLAVARNDHKYKLPYPSFVGGAIATRAEDYQAINGFSNLYFGWGSEDDDINERFTKAKHYPMKRYPTHIAYYTMFKHEHAVENKGRWKLVKAWRTRWSKDGFGDVMNLCTISKVEKRKLATFIHIGIDENSVVEKSKKVV